MPHVTFDLSKRFTREDAEIILRAMGLQPCIASWQPDDSWNLTVRCDRFADELDLARFEQMLERWRWEEARSKVGVAK